MKENWEIKKLGDLTTALNGLWVGKKPPFVNIAVIRNTNFTKDCQLDTTDIAYIDAEVKHFSTRKLQCGDIIIEKSGGSDKQPVGRPVLFNIPEGDFSFSNFTSTLRINDQSEILPSFLHKALWAIYRSGKTASLQSKTTGIRNLDFKSYLKLPIPVPPVAEQEKIVAELDCLTGIIEKKKQQLEELDKLAQSIFYDMFGDPITNEKGWKHIPFEKSIEKVKYTRKLQSKDYLKEGRFPIISQEEEYISGYWNDESDVFPVPSPVVIFGDHTRVLKYVDFDFVLGADGVRILLPIRSLSPVFLLYYLKSCKIPSLGYSRHYKLLKEISVAVPPLDYQLLFAQIIDAIEKQKELVKRSMAETETLFNSRMDFWFN